MNIHPLFVHFPIALLVMYALMEIIPRAWIFRIKWWRNAKIFLSITGLLATIPTLITGDMAADIIGETKLIETHALMAIITVSIFAIPAVFYLVEIFESLGWSSRFVKRYPNFKSIVIFINHTGKLVLNPPIIYMIAFLAIISITITGGLGASIVYGPDFDPVISFIYRIFF